MLKTAKAMPTKIDVLDGDWTTEEVLVAVKCHEELLAHAMGRYADISNTAEASRTEFEKHLLKSLERIIASAGTSPVVL